MMPDKDVDKERYARENHSEIERRRRNKMTAYITELSDMVPTCSALARKPDKLTILRMAVAHMKSLRGTGNTHSGDGAYKPSFLTDQELKHLILEAADGFLFVVACDSGKVIYSSDSVTSVLNHNQYEFQNSSFFDWVHPDDMDKVREQLSTQDLSYSSRVLDMKSGTVKKESHQSAMRICIGSRRGFICRMRLGNVQTESMSHLHRLRQRNGFGQSNDGHQYAVLHVTGYTKNWPSSSSSMDPLDVDDGSGNGFCCLVAIGRLQVISTSDSSDSNNSNSLIEFMSRHSIDGRYKFVDQRVKNVLGFKPQELIGCHIYDFINPDDLVHLRDCFDQAIQLRGQIVSALFRIKTLDNNETQLKAQLYAFINPSSNEVEYIVATNTLADRATGFSSHNLNSNGNLSERTLQTTNDDHSATTTLTTSAAATTLSNNLGFTQSIDPNKILPASSGHPQQQQQHIKTNYDSSSVTTPSAYHLSSAMNSNDTYSTYQQPHLHQNNANDQQQHISGYDTNNVHLKQQQHSHKSYASQQHATNYLDQINPTYTQLESTTSDQQARPAVQWATSAHQWQSTGQPESLDSTMTQQQQHQQSHYAPTTTATTTTSPPITNSATQQQYANNNMQSSDYYNNTQ